VGTPGTCKVVADERIFYFVRLRWQRSSVRVVQNTDKDSENSSRVSAYEDICFLQHEANSMPLRSTDKYIHDSLHLHFSQTVCVASTQLSIKAWKGHCRLCFRLRAASLC
jgi:hypothetical protein